MAENKTPAKPTRKASLSEKTKKVVLDELRAYPNASYVFYLMLDRGVPIKYADILDAAHEAEIPLTARGMRPVQKQIIESVYDRTKNARIAADAASVSRVTALRHLKDNQIPIKPRVTKEQWQTLEKELVEQRNASAAARAAKVSRDSASKVAKEKQIQLKKNITEDQWEALDTALDTYRNGSAAADDVGLSKATAHRRANKRKMVLNGKRRPRRSSKPGPS